MSVTGQGRVSARSSVLILLSILALVLSAAYLVRPLVPGVLAAEPTVVLEEGIEGCMGVRTTPGSENTTKELVGGTLEPGGTATFRFTFPAEVEGNPGQEEWKLTDCVFINDDPQQKYTVTALENDVSPVIIEFTLTIPEDTQIGDEFCNYAKTTETPSDPQASNRKAGPACFIIGGALRVEKVDAADMPLAGATFDVDCDWPNVSSGTFLPDTIVSATPDGSVDGGGPDKTFDSLDDGSFSAEVVTGSDGAISVNGPVGTACTFTETAAPDGYDLPANPSCDLTVETGEQKTCTFVNELTPTPTPTPSPTPTPTATPTPTPEQSVQVSTPTPTPEQSVQGGTGTPGPSQPDTAMGNLLGPSPLPTLGFAAVLLLSLGTLAFANVRSVRRRE
jgi:hypothetical protein